MTAHTGRSHAARLIAPLVVLLALAGCTSADPSSPGGAPEEGATSTTTTSCLIDTAWQLDIDDMAAQLFVEMQDTGMPIVAVNGFGSHELQFAEEGLATNSVDVTFELVLAPSDAPTSVTQLRQFGSAYGDWAWIADSDRVAFSNWESDVKLEMSIEVSGVVTMLPTTDLPLTDTTGIDMAVSCSADGLETRPDGSPFIQRWNAG